MAVGPLRRWADDADDTESWMAWRNADLEQKPEADALARELWNRATRSGDDLQAAQPSDLTTIGLTALSDRPGPSPDNSAGSGAPGSQAQVNNEGVDEDLTTPETPDYRTVTARPGDSISRLMGTARPEAIGRFVSLNGLKNSNLQAGQSYRVPSSYGDATPGESAIGRHLLRSDNARIAAVRAQAANQAQNDLFAQRLNAGLNVWTGEAPGRDATPRRIAPRQVPEGWEQSKPAKIAGAAAAYTVGAAVGVPRAAYHAARDLKDVGAFGLEGLGVLGPEAQARAIGQAADAFNTGVDYASAAIRDPSKVGADVKRVSKAAVESINPFDVPMSGTLQDIMSREYGKGKNFGEAATNIVGTVAGIEILGGLNAVRTFEATRPANIAKFIEQGMSPELAEYLSKPYEGMGHHTPIPRRMKIPETMLGIPIDARWAGKPIPKWIVDNPLNVSKPLGKSQGDFYEYHYGTDPKYYGGSLPRDLNGGKGWSGQKLGLKRYNPAQRIWNGTPLALKGALASVPVGEGLGIFGGSSEPFPQ